jgi:transcriptional repressor NrdR
MRCPFCQSSENRVVDSRMARDGRAIRRRRQCEGCSERFTTYEVVEEAMLDVEKRDGQSEPFDPEKLLKSIRLACKKRPVGTGALSDFVERLESRMSARPRRAVTSRELGDSVLAFLRTQDPVAYVRYASVYRSFDSVEAFLSELATFEQKVEAAPEDNALDASEPPSLAFPTSNAETRRDPHTVDEIDELDDPDADIPRPELDA